MGIVAPGGAYIVSNPSLALSAPHTTFFNSFSPIFRADSSKLCKTSIYQKKSKKYKSVKKKPNLAKKGSLKDNYFEATFKSDYLDIIQFLKEIQLFDVNVTPLCIEVNSQQKSQLSSSEKKNEYDSLIIPLNKGGQPLISKDEVDKINITSELGNVETKLVLKIFSRLRHLDFRSIGWHLLLNFSSQSHL